MTKTTISSSFFLLLLVTPAAANPHGTHNPFGQAFYEVGGVWHRSPDACGTHQRPPVANPDARLAPPPALGLRTVFLNKNGGTYTPGATNAATNTSQLVDSGSITIPAISTTFNWPTIASCVKAHFMKFNVRVVETEPTSGDFIEAVVGGDGTELGFGPNQLFGIASADNFCGVTERGIAFNFSETHRQVPRRDEELCATIAHEVGHLIALEHEQLAPDIMSYVLINDSGTKAFVNQASGCGTSPSDPSGCSCGGGSTNSAGRLQQFIGLRDTETVPPSLTVSTPSDALKVPPTFDIVVEASDNAAMSDVVANIDNVEVGNDTEPEGTTYKITARNVAEGNHILTVIAHDAAGNATQKDIPIIVAKLATGEDCLANEACTGGVCAVSGEERFCTQACDPNNNTCPDDFDCEVVGASPICVPGAGGCGCTSSNPGAMGMLALLVGGLLARRRRRR